MMRRVPVPACGPMMTAKIAARLDFLLRPPGAVPEYDRKLHPIAGVRWPRGAVHIPLPWEVAMFEVTDPGEVQEW